MSPRSKLGLWYLLFLAAIGAFHPYLAVVLDDAGASGLAKAAILALFPLGSVLSGPALTWLADRLGRSVLVLRVAVAVTAVAAVALTLRPALGWLVPWILVLSFARAPTSSIVDMLTTRRLGMGRAGYGGVRAWGSVGFILSAATVGIILDDFSKAPLYANAGLVVLLFLLTLSIRPDPVVPASSSHASLRTVLSNRALVAIYAVGILHQATISFYDHFYALHVIRTLELDSWVASASIVLGVGLEVLILANGHRLLSRLSPGLLILAGIASGIPRWLLTASTADPVLLIASQSLHGLGFGAWWVGAIALVDRNAPGPLRNSAQGLFMASSHGLGTLVAMGTAAALLDRASTTLVFLANAALSTAALVLAVVLLLPVLRGQTRSEPDEALR